MRANNRERYREREKGQYNERRWASHVLRKYGLTRESYDTLLSRQEGTCAICKDNTAGSDSRRFHVDHDHDTGAVRGLLCSRCNQMIGYGRDNPAILLAASLYLEGTRQ